MTFNGGGRRKEGNNGDTSGEEEGNDGGREGRRVLTINTEDGSTWTNGWERAYFNFSDSRGSCCNFHC